MGKTNNCETGLAKPGRQIHALLDLREWFYEKADKHQGKRFKRINRNWLSGEWIRFSSGSQEFCPGKNLSLLVFSGDGWINLQNR